MPQTSIKHVSFLSLKVRAGPADENVGRGAGGGHLQHHLGHSETSGRRRRTQDRFRAAGGQGIFFHMKLNPIELNFFNADQNFSIGHGERWR